MAKLFLTICTLTILIACTVGQKFPSSEEIKFDDNEKVGKNIFKRSIALDNDKGGKDDKQMYKRSAELTDDNKDKGDKTLDDQGDNAGKGTGHIILKRSIPDIFGFLDNGKGKEDKEINKRSVELADENKNDKGDKTLDDQGDNTGKGTGHIFKRSIPDIFGLFDNDKNGKDEKTLFKRAARRTTKPPQDNSDDDD